MKSNLGVWVAALVIALSSSSGCADESSFYLKDGDKVVFYGDSITEQRLYTTYTELYTVTRFPNLKVDFVHSGWGGDRVVGGGGGPIDRRLARDVFAYNPTVVTIMLGMNDGAYKAFDQKTADTYQQGYQYILDQIKQHLSGVRLTLIQPSPYDDITKPIDFPGGYNGVLKTYGQYVKDLAAKSGATTTDFNSSVNEMITKAYALDPNLAKSILPDRVHPSPGGHLIMAETLLKTWNAPSLVSDVEVDAAASKVTRAVRARIEDLKAAETVSWTETDEALPLPVDPTEPEPASPVVALVLKSSDFTEALNREPLAVTGLKEASYQLAIDGDVVDVFTREDLAKGINLATHVTPMLKQAKEVKVLVLRHSDVHFLRWRSIQQPLLDKNEPKLIQDMQPILDDLDAEEKAVVDQLRAKAQPVAHHYQLSPVSAATAVAPGIVPTDVAMPAGLGPNLALHKAFVSSDKNESWDFGLTDGSYVEAEGTTYATASDSSFPKTVTIDLEKNVSLTNIVVGNAAFGGTKKVAVSLGTTADNFKEVGTFTFPQNATMRHLYTFPATEGRFVRLTYVDHYDSTTYGPGYVFTTEVEAYGPAER